MNQKGLRLVGGAIQGGMRDIPAEFLLHCRTYQDALRIGIKFSLSRLDECRVAERMGMSKGHLNKIINCDLLEAGPKRKMMSEYQMEQFEEVVGNNALSKYWVLKFERLLDHQREQIDPQMGQEATPRRQFA